MRVSTGQLALGVSAALLLLAACAQRSLLPDLGGIYDEAARHHDPGRNPIVVIPGILGSRLEDTASGRVVWGAFRGDYANPQRPDGARLVGLPMRWGVPLEQLSDGVEPRGALDSLEVEVFGLPIVLDAYRYILGVLGVGGYRDEGLGSTGAVDYGDDHYTCFQFDYDWRRSVSENAARLDDFLREKAEYVRRETEARFGESQEVRFDIVAHSMGGLVTRYYLRHGRAPLGAGGELPPLTWEGAALVERAILVGTPNQGSIQALVELTEGVKLGPFTPKYPPAVLGTMPAVYQLLPRARHGVLIDSASGEPLDLLDLGLWKRMDWGLVAEDQAEVLESLLPDVADPEERRAIALDHLDKCLNAARRLAAALDRPASAPPGTELYLLAGDAVDTPFRAEVRSSRVSILETAPGDGTVMRSSALADERIGSEWEPRLVSPIDWSGVQFIFRDHLGLTQDPIFTDNVLYLLLEDPR